MEDKVVFCKNNEGFDVKVGTFKYDDHTGEYTFYKNKPHVFGKKIMGPGFEAYAIQRHVYTRIGKRKGKEYDMLALFKKHPGLIVVIDDHETGKKYRDTAADWMKHYRTSNYGSGQQFFVSIIYLNEI